MQVIDAGKHRVYTKPSINSVRTGLRGKHQKVLIPLWYNKKQLFQNPMPAPHARTFQFLNGTIKNIEKYMTSTTPK
jgi:hypothetical protein